MVKGVKSAWRVGRQPLFVSGLLLSALLLSALSGCGTSQYNALANRGVARLRGEAKFQGLYAPTAIPGSPFSVRVPVIFTNSYTPNSGHPDDGDKINPLRMQPPFLPAGDAIKLTYEGTTKDAEGRKVPYYCYVAAGEAKPGEVDKLASDIESGLKQIFPEPPPAWESVDADTPLGKAMNWRKIRAVGPQPFFVKVDGKVEQQKLPGVFELWLHDAGDHVAIIAWRSPVSVEGPQTGEFTLVGGMAVPVDDAKPDFSKWPILTAGSLEVTGPSGG